MNKYKVYMGWDQTETLAYDVARASIKRTSGKEIQIFPLELQNLGEFINRPIQRNVNGHKMWCPISEAPMSVEFAISRFLVPFLNKKGWAVFMDCDVVVLKDIKKLFELADPTKAVMVVKHQQTSGASEKHGFAQTYYNRKNWSSVVLWNCEHPSHQNLTLEMINSLPGRDLHAFCWLKDEEIGELPQSWNYLVDVNPPMDKWQINLAHYTMGGPWIKGWEAKDSDAIWNQALKEAKIK